MTDNTDRITPDEVIAPDGDRVRARTVLAEMVTIVPNLVKLIGRLLADKRVPLRAKLTIGAAGLYVASPIDLIPEFVPVAGFADDLLVVMFALDNLITRAGPEVVTEHWDGPGDILSLVQDVIGVSRSLMPKRLSGLLERISG